MSTQFIYTSIVLVVFILTQILSLSTSIRLKEGSIIKKSFLLHFFIYLSLCCVFLFVLPILEQIISIIIRGLKMKRR